MPARLAPMSGSSIELRLLPDPAPTGFSRPFAGTRLISDWPICPGDRRGPAPPPRPSVAGTGWRLDYRGPGLAEGRIQEILAETSAPWHRVTFEDGERFLACDEGWIARETDNGSPGAVTLERALGAPLALALAARGVYLLHASAIETAAGVIALVGDSGAGKSTFARFASEAGQVRIADDQLPVRLGGAPAALPHFPQLKLAPEAWYPDDAPAELKLHAVVAFRHEPETAASSLTPVLGAAACLLLVRSTVSSRLFGPAALEAHLAAAAAATARLGVFELEFPSGPAGLRAALALLTTLT